MMQLEFGWTKANATALRLVMYANPKLRVNMTESDRTTLSKLWTGEASSSKASLPHPATHGMSGGAPAAAAPAAAVPAAAVPAAAAPARAVDVLHAHPVFGGSGDFHYKQPFGGNRQHQLEASISARRNDARPQRTHARAHACSTDSSFVQHPCRPPWQGRLSKLRTLKQPQWRAQAPWLQTPPWQPLRRRRTPTAGRGVSRSSRLPVSRFPRSR